MKKLAVTSICALFVVLSGCGGSGDAESQGSTKPSAAQWRAAVEDRIGHPFRNDAAWKSYQSGWEDTCKRNKTPDDWAMYVAVGVDSGFAAREAEEDVRYACPEALDDVGAAIKQIQDNAGQMDEACSLDPALRTQEQQDLVDAVGC